MRATFALLLFALAGLSAVSLVVRGGAEASAARPAPAPEQRAGGVVVKFRGGISLSAVASALGDARSDPAASTGGSRLVLVQPQPGQSEDAVIASLRSRGDVEFAEPNRLVSIAASPTDPLYASNQWSLPQIGLPTAWDTSTGNSSVIVAVIDTGADATHPDLAGKITSGANAGFNFVANNTNTADDHFHGTFVASIVAMNTNNGQGGAGVCWACKIMPVKVLDNTGSGSTFNVAQGVDWAVAHGAKVINLSLGSAAPDSSLQTAVDNAWNAGVIVVAASGNNNGPVVYPAAYPNVLAVGSNNQAGVRSSFSNFGPELDLMAPGEGVFGALCACAAYTGGYGTGSGTSFASPHLAGVVALLISAGITDKNEIRTRLTTTATDMDVPGFDNNTGWGRVNAAAAIGPQYRVTWGANTLPATMAVNSSTGAAVTFTNTGPATWAAGGVNPVRFAYHWRNGACPGTSSAVFDGVRTVLPGDIAPGGAVTNLSATITAPASAGTYCLLYDLVKEGVTWFASQGAATQSATVTVATPAYAVTWGANTLPPTVAANGSSGVNVSFTNAGAATWTAGGVNPVRFAYHWRNGACPGTSSAVFDGVRTVLPGDIAPGGAVTNLSATITGPATAGTYCLQYDLVKEGITWFSSQGAATQSATVTVTARAYDVVWTSQSFPASMTAGSTTTALVSLWNVGSLTWLATGPNPVHFSYHWLTGACWTTGYAVFDGLRTSLPVDVPQNGTAPNLSVSIAAPATAGTYCLVYDLVQEGVTWFAAQGSAVIISTVTVT